MTEPEKYEDKLKFKIFHKGWYIQYTVMGKWQASKISFSGKTSSLSSSKSLEALMHKITTHIDRWGW